MDCAQRVWKEERYQLLLEHVKRYKEAKYQMFQKKIIPNVGKIWGVRIPTLRKIAKEIVKESPIDYLYYMENSCVLEEGSYEEIMVYGLVIGYLGEKTMNRKRATKNDDIITIEDLKRFITNFLPRINNWSVCDTFCATLKVSQQDSLEMFLFIDECLKSEQEYSQRFALVMLLNYYIKEEYLDFIFQTCNELNTESYYVRMAAAWLLSMVYIKFENETMEYLEKQLKDDWIYRKTIQKILESNQVSKETKEWMKMKKRKSFLKKN